MTHIIAIIYKILRSFDWYSTIIVIGACATAICIGLLVASPMGATPL